MHLRCDDGGGGGRGSSRGCTTNSGRARAGFSLCIDAISINVVVAAACSAVSIAESTEGSCYAFVRHFALCLTLSVFSLLFAFLLVACLLFASIPTAYNCCALSTGT